MLVIRPVPGTELKRGSPERTPYTPDCRHVQSGTPDGTAPKTPEGSAMTGIVSHPTEMFGSTASGLPSVTLYEQSGRHPAECLTVISGGAN
jgi:hypothetical protein